MKLVSVSLAALMLVGVIYAANATGQTPKSAQGCDAEPRDVSLYFERDRVELNNFSKVLVERVAAEAKTCGAKQVYAETRLDAARAAAISNEFQAKGIRLIVAGPKAATPAAGEDVAARSAKMRLTLASNRIG